jgi:MFS transporter, SP family, sugar:H+ symporter
MKDRHANARESLQVYREGKFTDEEIDNEIGMIVAGIRRESEKGSFLDIFRSQQIRRTMVVVGANFFMQATGQQFTSIYGALFVASLNTINPFIFTVITALVNLCTSVLANTLTDILGRR